MGIRLDVSSAFDTLFHKAAEGNKKMTLKTSLRFSNTATTMLSALYGDNKKKDVVAKIEADIADPMKVRKIQGYDDVYVARGHGLRVVFTRKDGASEITSVAVEAG